VDVGAMHGDKLREIEDDFFGKNFLNEPCVERIFFIESAV
jgi:hypothetical protein